MRKIIDFGHCYGKHRKPFEFLVHFRANGWAGKENKVGHVNFTPECLVGDNGAVLIQKRNALIFG
jgi:hypothetical protein